MPLEKKRKQMNQIRAFLSEILGSACPPFSPFLSFGSFWLSTSVFALCVCGVVLVLCLFDYAHFAGGCTKPSSRVFAATRPEGFGSLVASPGFVNARPRRDGNLRAWLVSYQNEVFIEQGARFRLV